MSRFDAVLFDLDGTVYHAGRAIEGARELLGRLRAEGIPYRFVTNRANLTPEFIGDRLREQGIVCENEHVLTAAEATAQSLAAAGPAGRVFVVGEAALYEALEKRGFVPISLTDDGPAPDWVIAGIDLEITYDKISRAVYWILQGASFVATNTDRLTTGPGGIKKAGAGAIIAAIATATDVTPRVIGKPQAALFEIALRNLVLEGRPAAPERILMVGDNLATDIAGGIAAGLPTAFLLTGVSTEDDIRRLGVEPTYTVPDYGALAEIIFSTKSP